MSIIRINQLPNGSGTLTDDDIFLIMDSPSSGQVTKSIRVADVRSAILNQPGALQFRQGTDAERLLIVPSSGEPIWTNDTNSFYIGNGAVSGGLYIGPSPYKLVGSTIVYSGYTLDNVNNSTILGGSNNALTTSNNCHIYGGTNNHINESEGGTENFTDTDIILGGFNNTMEYPATNSIIIGGTSNIVYESNSIILGGNSNNCSNMNSTIIGGSSNVMVGGGACDNSVIIGGTANDCYTTYSCVIGGSGNSLNSENSVILGGRNGKTTHFGSIAHSAGAFSNGGDAQHMMLCCRRLTTDATANVVLTLDGNAPGSTNRLLIPAQTVWNFTVKISAYNVTDNAGGAWTINGSLRRNAANSTVILGTNVSNVWTDAAMNTASTSVVADDGNEALEIRVTGIAAKNIRWSATVDINQVSYGAV